MVHPQRVRTGARRRVSATAYEPEIRFCRLSKQSSSVKTNPVKAQMSFFLKSPLKQTPQTPEAVMSCQEVFYPVQ